MTQGEGGSRRFSDMISVIMPCYNGATHLAEAIESVMNQSRSHIELIVIDDGSTDASISILQSLAAKYDSRMHLLFQHRMGPYPARNRGLAHARGEKIAFLDADDWWDKECLEKLDAALEDQGADIAYCGWQNVGTATPSSDPYVPPDYRTIDTAEAFLRSCPWPIHAALVRRTSIDAVGGFSERRFSAMDYDLWLRLYGHTDKIVRVPEILAFYRWHGGEQISKTRWKQVLDAVEVRKAFARKHPERVAHLTAQQLDDLTRGSLLREAYRAYWKRDLTTAQYLFRRSLLRGIWHASDLKYLAPALLPNFLFTRLIAKSDQLKEGR